MIPAIIAEEDRVLGIDDQYPLARGNHRERRKLAGKWMPQDGALSLIERADLPDDAERLTRRNRCGRGCHVGLSEGVGNTRSGRGRQPLASRKNVIRVAGGRATLGRPRGVAAL